MGTMRQSRAFKGHVSRSLMALALAAGMVFSTGGIASAEVKVVKAADGNNFKPQHRWIDKGDSVKWKNTDNVSHNVKALDAQDNWNYFRHLSPGETAKRQFNNIGDYKYKCTLHSGMWGLVHVRQYPG